MIGKKEEDIDLMQFISNMDVSNIKEGTSNDTGVELGGFSDN